MFNYKNAKIRTKLLTGFMLLAAIATLINAINAFQLAQIRGMQQRLFSQNIKPMEKLVALTEAFQKMRVASRDINLAKTPEAFEKGNSMRKESFRIVNDSLTAIAANSPDSKTLVNNLKDSITHFNTILEKIEALARADKSEEGNRTPEVANTVKSCTEQLAALTASIISHGNGNTEKTISITNSALFLSMICAMGMLLLAVILGILITRSITGPVQNLKQQAEKIAAGDLTVRIIQESRDEIGMLAASFIKMTDSLCATLQSVDSTSAQVATASSQLQSTSELIATGAEEVSCQAQTVATASEELSATSGDIAQNCLAGAKGSQQATEAARTGAKVVSQTVDVMTRIAERVTSTARSVEELGARSDQIGTIVGTIEDIADQTNLLALNAAIEAARAGEQGRGFAVVADEVRALAERTSRATREIGDMIKAIQTETKSAVTAMHEGVLEVKQGTDEAANSGIALQEILEQINAVTAQVNQIATAAEEQSATTTEITNNIHQISEVVKQTAQGSQESAAAAGQLARLSDDLRSLIKQFRLA